MSVTDIFLYATQMERQIDVVSTTVAQNNQVNPVNAAGYLPASSCNGQNPFTNSPYGAVPPPYPWVPPFVTAPINFGRERHRGPEFINENATINPVTVPANSSVQLTFSNVSGCCNGNNCGGCNQCNRCSPRRCNSCNSGCGDFNDGFNNRGGCGSCGNRSCGGCNSCNRCSPCRSSCPPFNRCPRPDQASVTLNLTLAGTVVGGQSTVIITAGDRMIQTIMLVGTESRSINTTFEVFSFQLPVITVQNTGNMPVQVVSGSISLRGIHHRLENFNRFNNFNNFDNGFGFNQFGGFNNFNNGFF